MTFIEANLAELFLIAGLVMLGVEILILGFATFILFFVGLACVITALFMYSGVVATELNQALLVTGVLTVALAVGLWNKLKELQKRSEPKKATSDLIGMTFQLKMNVSPDTATTYRYSGVQWLLKSESAIKKGAMVKVTDVEVGVMYITEAEESP